MVPTKPSMVAIAVKASNGLLPTSRESVVALIIPNQRCSCFRMGLSDGREHRLWIGRLSHGLGFGIMAIVHLRIISARFFEQLDDLRRFLLTQNRELQGELLTPLSKLILTPLRRQDHHHNVKRYQGDRASQPGKGWRV
jgi:hypothetical protein